MTQVVTKYVEIKTMDKKKFIIINLTVIIIMIILMFICTLDFGAKEIRYGYTGERTYTKACFNNPQCDQKNDFDVVYQSMDLFYRDNLNYRGNMNTISYKGEYINHEEIENIIFLSPQMKSEKGYKSGDIITIDGVNYTVVDNPSNCYKHNNDPYCVEILDKNHKYKGVEYLWNT